VGDPLPVRVAGAFALTSTGASLVLGPFGNVVFLSYFAAGLVVGGVSLATVVLTLWP